MAKTSPQSALPKGANGITCAPIVVKSSFSSSSVSLFHSLDTLVVSLWLDWFHYSFLKELETSRSLAQELDVPVVPCNFHGNDWSVHRSAPGYFRYKITSGDITVLLSKHRSEGNIPNCKIEIGSLSCWSGAFNVFNKLKKKLIGHGSKVEKEIVSRVDMAVDAVGVPIQKTNVQDEDYWICKARSFGMFRRNRKLTGITYGKGNIMLRIYDKVAELKVNQATNKQEEFSKIWGVKEYEEKAVTRTEFQIRREVLKDFGDERRVIDTTDDLQKYLSSLWKYCVNQWAKHCSNLIDRENKNQKRSENSNFWKIIRKVRWSGYARLTRTVNTVRKNLQALKEQMRGIAVTLASSTGLGHDDYFNIVSVAQEMLSKELHKYMTDKPVEFIRKYQQRQSECLTAIG